MSSKEKNIASSINWCNWKVCLCGKIFFMMIIIARTGSKDRIFQIHIFVCWARKEKLKEIGAKSWRRAFPHQNLFFYRFEQILRRYKEWRKTRGRKRRRKCIKREIIAYKWDVFYMETCWKENSFFLLIPRGSWIWAFLMEKSSFHSWIEKWETSWKEVAKSRKKQFFLSSFTTISAAFIHFLVIILISSFSHLSWIGQTHLKLPSHLRHSPHHLLTHSSTL